MPKRREPGLALKVLAEAFGRLLWELRAFPSHRKGCQDGSTLLGEEEISEIMAWPMQACEQHRDVA